MRRLENAYLAKLAGVLRAAKVPESVLGGAGRTRVRCAALRLNIRNGRAGSPHFALDAGRVLLQGSGTIELGPETLALRPTVRVGPVEVPVRVGGTLARTEADARQRRRRAHGTAGSAGRPWRRRCLPAALAAARGEPVAAAPAATRPAGQAGGRQAAQGGRCVPACPMRGRRCGGSGSTRRSSRSTPTGE